MLFAGELIHFYASCIRKRGIIPPMLGTVILSSRFVFVSVESVVIFHRWNSCCGFRSVHGIFLRL